MRKNVLSFLFVATCLVTIVAGCKKHTKSPEELILGKWYLHTLTYREVEGTDTDEQIFDRRQSGDYFDLRANGSAEISEDGSVYQISYQLVDNHTLKIDGLILTIEQLTQKELKLYRKIEEDSYSEEWWYEFKR